MKPLNILLIIEIIKILTKMAHQENDLKWLLKKLLSTLNFDIPEPPQHSTIFGHLASSHTVDKLRLRS